MNRAQLRMVTPLLALLVVTAAASALILNEQRGHARYLRPPGDLDPQISWRGRVTGKGAKLCLLKGGW